MQAQKIHCDFFEIVGLDWNSVDDVKARQIVQTIESMEFLGKEPDLNGFVGTATLDTIIGGFFALQYEAELLHYDTQKNLQRAKDLTYERLFFILFGKTGKVVLQNRKFVDLPLNMEWASRRFIDALSEAFKRSQVNILLTLYSPEAEVSPEVFQSEFKKSDRVHRLRVESPDPSKISAEFVYYNPQIDRNSIIRESHQHDYPNFHRVDLEAHSGQDLKGTHIARDLIESASPVLMRYHSAGEEHTLRRSMPKKFEIYVDVDVEVLTTEMLQTAVQTLRAEVGLPVDIPTSVRDGAQQTMFDYFRENEDEEDE